MSRANTGNKANDPEIARLQRRTLQFLVHSFLYYRLDEPIVSDAAFDRIAKELRRLRKAHPKDEIPHSKLVDEALGPEDTAFQIRTYPPDVVTSAFKLLYGQQRPDMGFVEFVERRGYRAHLAHDQGATDPPGKTAGKGKAKKERKP